MKVMEDKRRVLNQEFDSEPSFYHRYNFSLIRKYLKGKRVLDIGCWSGQFEKLAVNDSLKVVGIDPGSTAITFAKKAIRKAHFVTGKAQQLPFKNGSFDVAVFCDVIEHLPNGDENKALKEINRILVPGGYLLLSTPNNHPISIILDPAYFLIGHRHYSYKSLQLMLVKNGFTVIKNTKKGGLVRLISSNIEMIYKHIFRKKFIYPVWLNNLIIKEMKKEGFAQNHIIAIKK